MGSPVTHDPVTNAHSAVLLSTFQHNVEWEVALAAGVSGWHQNARAADGIAPAKRHANICWCDKVNPSFSHILWACPTTERNHPRGELVAPSDRCEERLLAKCVRPRPGPVCFTDKAPYASPDLLQQLQAHVANAQEPAGSVFTFANNVHCMYIYLRQLLLMQIHDIHNVRDYL